MERSSRKHSPHSSKKNKPGIINAALNVSSCCDELIRSFSQWPLIPGLPRLGRCFRTERVMFRLVGIYWPEVSFETKAAAVVDRNTALNLCGQNPVDGRSLCE